MNLINKDNQNKSINIPLSENIHSSEKQQENIITNKEQSLPKENEHQKLSKKEKFESEQV